MEKDLTICDPTIERSWYLSDYVDVAREKYEQLIEKGSTPDEAFAKIWADREECTAEQLKEMLEIA